MFVILPRCRFTATQQIGCTLVGTLAAIRGIIRSLAGCFLRKGDLQ